MDTVQRLARLFDPPPFSWKKIIIYAGISSCTFEGYLLWRQYRVLKRRRVPKVLRAQVSQTVYDQNQAYSRATTKFIFVNGLYTLLTNVAIIQYDVLPKVWAWSGCFVLSFAPKRFTGEISQSIVWVLSFAVIWQSISLPMAVYRTFVIEGKFACKKQTPHRFIIEKVKSCLLAVVVVTSIVAGFLTIAQRTGNQFFLYLWLPVASYKLTAMDFSPTGIPSISGGLSPLPEGQLKTGVEDLAKKLEFPLRKLLVIDNSNNSAPSNTYLFGLSGRKHIAIDSTMIEESSEEVIAVLAHQLGYWSLGNTTKSIAFSQAHLFYISFLVSAFLKNASLYQDFGFAKDRPLVVGVPIIIGVLSPMEKLIMWLGNTLNRRFEIQADRVAQSLGYQDGLAAFLIKRNFQNVSAVNADWMWTRFFFRHATPSERLRALCQTQGGCITGPEDEE